MRATQVHKSQLMLSKAIENFMNAGGKINRVPGFKAKPVPVRSTLQSEKRREHDELAAKAVAEKAEEDRKRDPLLSSSQVERIIAMASLGLSVIQISNRVKVSRHYVSSLGREMNIEITEIGVSRRVLNTLPRK